MSSSRTAFTSLVLTGLLFPITLQAETVDLEIPAGPVILELYGNIGRTNSGDAARFDMEMLRALPVHALETTTSVTDGVRHFEGFLMRDLLELVSAQGEIVRAIALNDYLIDIPVEDFIQFDVLVAYEMDGEPLHVRDKGPLWIVYPRDDHRELQDIRFDYRWVWQLYRLDIQ